MTVRSEMNAETLFLADDMGETISYTPDGEAAQSVTAIVTERRWERAEEAGGGAGWRYTAVVLIKQADVAAVDKGGTVTIDSLSYRFDGGGKVGGFWRLEVAALVKDSHGREGFQR